VTGRRNRRPVGWLAASRVITTPPHRDIAEKANGILSSDVSIHDAAGMLAEHDADHDGTLDAARFITLRTYVDEEGIWFGSGNLMGPSNDIQRLADRRVLNAVAEVLQRAMRELLKLPFARYASNVKAPYVAGNILEADARSYERSLLTALNAAIKDQGMVSGIQVQLNRTPVSIGQGTWKLVFKVKVFGLAYIDEAETEYGFVDPLLDAILNKKAA
jgi:hypothetical protein